MVKKLPNTKPIYSMLCSSFFLDARSEIPVRNTKYFFKFLDLFYELNG